MKGGLLGKRDVSTFGTVEARGADGKLLKLTGGLEGRSSGH